MTATRTPTATGDADHRGRPRRRGEALYAAIFEAALVALVLQPVELQTSVTP